ncbi:alcohol dehydrogenase YqhD (iron-dependent ADH family) [Clostridium moniliforme]|uniref:Alcohol dehydrogenase YqhD (Iron-dependent ADH family) n=1 Tax=Clostridium moniliforme TaxID=39489 RepID=A0ABS4EZP1_9CLOT|nr:iron-containing alcohol dehydrogenase [Clostridium moniliforme]MBP1889466.1 alcohol dehydrogenase YqhD (iron-dependent ADH family) [Clostridium moniliforme]
MENFDYSIKTEIYFGKGQISKLGEILLKYGNKVLLVYGGGSIKKIGLYDNIKNILKKNNIECVELSGVDPNPRIESVDKGVKLVRENNIDVILPVGGGSTIDCAKAISGASFYEGNPWDIVKDSSKIKKVLPIVTVLTLSATGSEMDPFAVISNMNTNEKLGLGNEMLRPKASILDPEYTYSVPKNQTAAGTADIMSHIFEVYFSRTKDAYLQDKMAEGLLKTCIKYGEIAYNDPDNYEARANLMWASSLAINGILSCGKKDVWTVHPIEHELSAFYDITHGVGLAILTPHWMRYVLNEDTLEKFYEFGVNVWDIDRNLDKKEVAELAIKRTSDYFKTLGIPQRLRDIGIDDSKFKVMADKAVKFGGLKNGYVPLNSDDVVKIFEASL